MRFEGVRYQTDALPARHVGDLLVGTADLQIGARVNVVFAQKTQEGVKVLPRFAPSDPYETFSPQVVEGQFRFCRQRMVDGEDGDWGFMKQNPAAKRRIFQPVEEADSQSDFVAFQHRFDFAGGDFLDDQTDFGMFRMENAPKRRAPVKHGVVNGAHRENLRPRLLERSHHLFHHRRVLKETLNLR